MKSTVLAITGLYAKAISSLAGLNLGGKGLVPKFFAYMLLLFQHKNFIQ